MDADFFEWFTNGCKRNPAQKQKVVRVRFPMHGHIYSIFQEINLENFKSCTFCEKEIMIKKSHRANCLTY